MQAVLHLLSHPYRLRRHAGRIFGGDGYFEDSPYGPTERLYRDARAMWLEEGAPNVQRITIARNCQKFGGKVEYQL